LARESMPAVLPVLDAAGVVDGVEAAITGTLGVVPVVAGGMSSPPGAGRASLLAAQPRMAMTRKLRIGMNEYRRTCRISSTGELVRDCGEDKS
jgi:hypothetical protein